LKTCHLATLVERKERDRKLILAGKVTATKKVTFFHAHVSGQSSNRDEGIDIALRGRPIHSNGGKKRKSFGKKKINDLLLNTDYGLDICVFD
jgi:hypothetical protein